MSEPLVNRRTRADWVFPPGTFKPPATAFVGAHHGAGTSIWASLLAGADAGMVMPESGVVVGVCRSTPAGIGAAKALIGVHGVNRFRAFMVVADASGGLPVRVRREVKILAGAVPVVQVPWFAWLRGAQVTDPVKPALGKAVARIKNQLAGIAKAGTESAATEALQQHPEEN